MSELDLPANIKFNEPEKSANLLRDALNDCMAVYKASVTKRTVELDNGQVVDAPWVTAQIKVPQYDESSIRQQIKDELEDFVKIVDGDDKGRFEVHYTYRVNGEVVAPHAQRD